MISFEENSCRMAFPFPTEFFISPPTELLEISRKIW